MKICVIGAGAIGQAPGVNGTFLLAKLAAIVWALVTFENAYALVAPSKPPSTVTSTMWKCEVGAIA